MSSSRALFFLIVAPVLWLAAPARAADVSVTLGAGNGFSIKNNTGAIERLRVDEATGNVSRNGALFVHTMGSNSLFVGPGAGALSSFGNGNSGFGQAALGNNTTGTFNSAFGLNSLSNNTTGSSNAAFGQGALNLNTTAINNSAFGRNALGDNTASYNSAFGQGALRRNTTGSRHSAFGDGALRYNTTGTSNSAFGERALYLNTTGSSNAAFGSAALRSNTTGSSNAAFGNLALQLATGARNIALGHGAGSNNSTGNDNIYIGNTGVASESGQIKIGTLTQHTGVTINGIHGVTSGGIGVLIEPSGKLGTTPSSARFKRDVRDMNDASEVLSKLHPVVFHYREEVPSDAEDTLQYGLIAEEVAAVAPELVVNDAEGKPYSVRYHVLPALLLNELQKQQRIIGGQQRAIEALLARVAELERRSPADAKVALR